VYAYIDESGDPGTGGRGSQWLIVGCAVVADNERQRVEDTVKALAQRMSSGRPLHFNRMGHEKKKASYGQLVGLGWEGIIAISDTTKPLPKKLRDPQTHYNDVLREVVRRVLWWADERGETPRIVIDRRLGRFNLQAFKAYLAAVDQDADAYTDWTKLDLDLVIDAEPDDEWCLCVADGLAHATYKMLEPDEWGNREGTYFNMCIGRLWGGLRKNVLGHYQHQREKNLLSNGIILLPEPEIPRFLRREFSWLR
jgi:hypothetical protein